MRLISGKAENQLASQAGLCSMELVSICYEYCTMSSCLACTPRWILLGWSSQDDWDRRRMWYVQESARMHITGFWWGYLTERENIQGLGADEKIIKVYFNTLRTGDADLRFYITTVQDGWRKSAFLTRACFPCTIHLIMQYIMPVSEWFCWRMFIENWPHSELTFRHRASSI